MKGNLSENYSQHKVPDGVSNPDGALPLFIGGGDRLGGEGVQEK